MNKFSYDGTTFYEYAKVSVRDRLNWWGRLIGKDDNLRQNYMPTEDAITYQMESSHFYKVEIEPMTKGWKPKELEKETR